MSPQCGLNCGLPALHTLLCLSTHSLFFLPVVTLTKTKMGFYELAPGVYGCVYRRVTRQLKRTLSAHYFKGSLLSKVTPDSLGILGHFVLTLVPNNDFQPWNMVLNCVIINNRLSLFSKQFLIPLLRINWLNGSLKSLSPLTSSPILR